MTERLDLGSLRSAITSLEESIAVVGDTAWFAAQTRAVQNTLLAGVIQNFEFVYELSVKTIKRQIEAEAATPGEVDDYGFRDLLRVAAEKGLIADVEPWFVYRQMRGISSHICDQVKARQMHGDTLAFVGDARALLAVLQARNA